ncbi:SusC/RagA family TonB-linked outer membrane protein [Bacteroides nordii]|uniref:SusC/RagA family TonB-linked outer membrane protein n=1 Tax=Bacteroides TaxID=816 RepID=UPI0003770EBC|nr:MULTISPECIES: SusC/RagA family TonB-linked outer membrane protein [Bacteroides]EOA59534.1 hypothetical protein HMPREF1214_01293 [Bacteroides sp. HPS0048]UAK42786.1 SusC/RagA family TonB-linked outer membrane protein [Bacteroides nordii]
MKSNHYFRSSKLCRALLILLLMVVPVQWSMAQLNLNTPHTTLKSIIQQIQAQSKFQFFYDDKLSDISVEPLSLKNAAVEDVLNLVLKGKNISFKVEDNIIYLSEKKDQNNKEQQQTGKEKKISGQVVDESGEPLIGVNVLVKGTTNGVITDFDGNYALVTNEVNPVITFSYIGYKSQEIPFKGQNVINLTLQSDTQIIDEIVVTALGIKREKKMLGYAVQDVKGDALTSTGDAQVANALQGKVAGLSINSSTTGLGGSAKITIRGNSSLADNNQPLWIVDGVPFTEESYSGASMYGGVDRGSTSFDINPEDIESISVLKGPNAAALYGSRAGNGVILVTTKKGTRKDGFGVNYSGTFTWTQVADELERQKKYGQGNNGEYSPQSIYSFGSELDGSLKTAWNGAEIPYLNYGSKMKDYFNTGFSQNHSVAIGNMKEDAHFRTSFGYSNADGMFTGESLRKINIDLNAGMKMNKYLSMDAKVSLSNTKAENRPTYGAYGEVSQLLLVPNNIRLSDLSQYSTPEKFHVNWTPPTTEYLNPYYVNKQRQNQDERWRAFGFYNLKLNFTDWLYLSAKYAFDYYRTRIVESDLSNGTKYNTMQEIEEDRLTRQEENHFESNAEFLLIGNNKFGEKFQLNYMAGANFMYSDQNIYGGDVENMTYKNQWYWNFANNINNVTENGWRRATNSVFGSVQMAYNEYVSLDITARNDWSSTLPKDNNSYFYPSFNLGFVASDFVRTHWNKMPEWITFAKVRLSAAKVGKDAPPYAIYNRWEGGYLKGQAKKPELSSTKANNNLRPETSWSYEAGLDMKFLNNRLGFDFTYYYTRTTDQIMTIPEAAPWKLRWINSGLIVNKGVEAMIYATPVQTKDFTFNLNVNLSHNTSTVKELNEKKKHIYFEGDQFMPVYVGAVEGGKLGDIYAKRMYKRDENGQIIMKNGVPVFTTDEQYSLDHPIGNIQPDLLMSVTPSFTYKGFTLSALFDMKFGGDVVSVSEAIATSHGISKRTEQRGELLLPGMNEDGTVNTQRIDAQLFYQAVGGRQQAVAEEFVYNASFIRLKEISFGYSFPSLLLRKTPVSSLRVSFVGRNLAYLMKHTPGTSPEGGYDTSMFSQALDFSSLPYSRTFGFSINVGF